MNRQISISRREWLKAGALAGAAIPLLSSESLPTAAAAAPGGDPWRGLKVGVATYTFREFPLEQTIKSIQRVGLKYVSVKNVKNHIDLSHSPEERKQRAQMLREAGLMPLSVGNVSLRGSEAEIRKGFEYARDVGVPTIVCAPRRDAIPLLDQLVKEFDLRLAIHNHGPEDKGYFPSPYDAMDLISKYDKRIGLCIDVGHTARAGVDPAEAILKCRDRLYDLHLKDISALGDKNTPIEAGRGILDLKAIFQALLKINYQHLVGWEYEKDGNDPLPGLAESVGYTKGLMAGLK
ncbi:MAG TPA: sugar phosphate isomerase/epimerase [Blastocatellia bacterium]|nr:sugar phosphate isomerase/epimerase [Blastocatellia bacterium]